MSPFIEQHLFHSVHGVVFKLLERFYPIMKKMKKIILILITGFLIGQPVQRSVLQDMDFQVKDNGLVLEFGFSTDISLNNASGWYAQTGWFYVTFLNTSVDSSNLPSLNKTELIREIQFDQIGESVQLSLKLSNPPENHEFFQRSDMKQLFLSLRSPMPIIVHTDSTVKQEIQIATTEVPKPELFIPEKDKTISKIGYVLGTSFTIAGVLQEDSKSSMNWELPAGIGILFGTYVYDKYFDNHNEISSERLEEDN